MVGVREEKRWSLTEKGQTCAFSQNGLYLLNGAFCQHGLLDYNKNLTFLKDYGVSGYVRMTTLMHNSSLVCFLVLFFLAGVCGVVSLT